MSVRRALVGLLALVLAGTSAACGRGGEPAQATSSRTSAGAGSGIAPRQPLAVGVRRITLRRGRDRPLPTTVWYPAVGLPGAQVTDGAAVAPGRFPVVLFSHGLSGLPESQRPLLVRWAAAGFVVAAPTYPRTQRHAPRIDRSDVRHQPADAIQVLTDLARLDTRPGDAFAGRLDTGRICAAGYSAGGYTTSGLFTTSRPVRLRCGIVISGGGLDAVGGDGRYRGPAAPMLFVHGDADRAVPYSRGRAAYDRVPWPKAFLTVHGGGHGEFLVPGEVGSGPVAATTTDFLRWALYHDLTAYARLPLNASVPGVTSLSNALAGRREG